VHIGTPAKAEVLPSNSEQVTFPIIVAAACIEQLALQTYRKLTMSEYHLGPFAHKFVSDDLQEIATPQPKHAWYQYDQSTCCTSKLGGSAEMENSGGGKWEYGINYSHKSFPPWTSNALHGLSCLD